MSISPLHEVIPRTENNAERYPYVSHYLWHFMKVEELTGEEIVDKVLDIQKWLHTTLDTKLTGFFGQNYQWSSGFLTTQIFNEYGASVHVSNSLRFQFEEDLLAFKLKFGISDTTFLDQ